MNMADRLRVTFPHYSQAEIERWIEAGREYASKLEKLPPPEKEAVTQLFASYGMCRIHRYKCAFRAAVDIVIRPYYPGVDHAADA